MNVPCRLQRRSGGTPSAADEAAEEASAAALEDLRELVHDAKRERGIDLLESFEHFDRYGKVWARPYRLRRDTLPASVLRWQIPLARPSR